MSEHDKFVAAFFDNFPEVAATARIIDAGGELAVLMNNVVIAVPVRWQQACSKIFLLDALSKEWSAAPAVLLYGLACRSEVRAVSSLLLGLGINVFWVGTEPTKDLFEMVNSENGRV